MSRAKPFHVLVATDGSAPARGAMSTAVRFPWPAGTRGFAVIAQPANAGYRWSLLASADRAAQGAARRATRALTARWPEGTVRVVGASPVEGVLDEARKVRADVIVLGWRGHGPVRRLLTGSVSRGVARQAPCSVLVVRRARRQIRRVVVGIDGSQNAARALELLALIPPPHGGRVTLVSVVDTMHVPEQRLAPARALATVAAEVSRINEERRNAARKRLARAARVLAASGVAVDQVVAEGAPLRELLACVVRARADLLVVGARGTTGLRRLLLGSVAEGAMNASPVPVLVVR